MHLAEGAAMTKARTIPTKYIATEDAIKALVQGDAEWRQLASVFEQAAMRVVFRTAAHCAIERREAWSLAKANHQGEIKFNPADDW
jgi:hypothetical protein